MTAILWNHKCDISATVWPILMKFGMLMHICPAIAVTAKMKFWKSKMADGRHLDNGKLWYLQNSSQFWRKFALLAINIGIPVLNGHLQIQILNI